MAKAALKAHGDAVLISINAKDGVAVGQEWVRDNPKLRAEELAAHLKEAGAKTVIYHDAAAEAAGQGPAVMYASRVGKAGVDVLVAGGIASLAHIRQCAATPGIAGVLAGKALAQGKFTLKQALETATEGFKERK
jgi:phosphoribosylformimino-5-aminoimidazole carboxamide ribotide isomerase